MACGHADGVLRPFGRRFAVFCCVKGGLSGGGKHVFGARKRCFAAADTVFSGGKYRQKNVKTSYFIAQNAAMRRNVRNVRQLRLHTILPVFAPGGILFFNGGLLTLQGNSMCKPPGRLRLHCVRRAAEQKLTVGNGAVRS